MRSLSLVTGVCTLGLLIAGCSSDATDPGSGNEQLPPEEEGVNPFLEDQGNLAKADTAYLNPDGIEVEVDVEADVVAPPYNLREAPANLAQYALTYLRQRGQFYLESLAEDSSSGERVEWLIDDIWMTAAEAEAVTTDKLKHFRIRGINAVLLHGAADGVKEGSLFTAKVPLNPYTTMTDGGNTCAEEDGHMTLDQSVYWYMWDPDKTGCKITSQEMKLTVSKMFSNANAVYPEYDKLVQDGKITAVVLFGQIGDGAISDSDIGMRGFRQMATWLLSAKFTEVTPAPVGRRFTKHIANVDYEIDLYSPHEFSGLSDYSHFNNFQTALGEHEIVVYDGHSMLGASDFWERPKYPSTYQIFLYGGCLGYEYYIRPILAGKGGTWENLDLMSSVVEVSVGANEFAGPFLAKLAWAIENKYNASWQDMLSAVRQRVRDSTFGASGVRGNCFSPSGSLCSEPIDPDSSERFEDATETKIPDNAAAGAERTIEIPDSVMAKQVNLELDVTHTWAGDLMITVEHDGTKAVVWDKTGGSTRNIQKTFTLDTFAGKEASGTWKLTVVDTAADDTGTLNKWALVVSK